MESTLKTWTSFRNGLSGYFENYSLEQLNTIPPGFSNNIIWNIGHLIVVQQAVVYRGSNLPMAISDELLERYKPGSKPTGETTQAEVDELKELLISITHSTIKDMNEGKFVSYNERTLGTGLHLASIKDALAFNNYHEGVHIGLMMNIKKFV